MARRQSGGRRGGPPLVAFGLSLGSVVALGFGRFAYTLLLPAMPCHSGSSRRLTRCAIGTSGNRSLGDIVGTDDDASPEAERQEHAMGLTWAPGPLAGTGSDTTNYQIDGPQHRLLMHPFPRRVRAEFGGETVLDTRAGVLLHETGLPPQLYVPEADLRTDLLEPTDHHTHCPFKGDASYRSLRVGDRVAENAVWAYPDPLPQASWLAGYAALYWSSVDRWLDEDEETVGHLTDPFHRVDIRASGRRVRVLAGDLVLAESTRPLVLSETSLPNRYYLPEEDVRQDLLAPSDTRTVCPYKGWASYWSLRADGRDIADVAWGYPEPLPESARIAGYRSFLHDQITVEVSDE